jgi:RNA methyltransferase, TrmH family
MDLRSFRGRERSGQYLIEGIRHVARAADEGARIQSLLVAPSALSNPFGQKLARRLRRSGIESLQLPPALYRDLTLAVEPQGLAAVVWQSWTHLADAKPNRNSLWLAVESIDSPGNLGTILRTAEAVAASGVILIGGGADPFDPGAVRASMGSLFSQRLIRCEPREFIAWVRQQGVTLLGSSPHGMFDYRQHRHPWPAALLIGAERRGLSAEMLDACHSTVRIPMAGRADSLNAAVATGILLYGMFYRRPHPAVH